MPRLPALSIAAALLAVAGSAGAQYRGAGGTSAPARSAPAAAVHQAGGGSWTGTASKWGGSPVQSRTGVRNEARGAAVYYGQTNAYYGQTSAYIPVAVAAPAPVPVTYASDTACATAAGPVDMQVITSKHEEHVLTTLEVYRLQPRFQKPR